MTGIFLNSSLLLNQRETRTNLQDYNTSLAQHHHGKVTWLTHIPALYGNTGLVFYFKKQHFKKRPDQKFVLKCVWFPLFVHCVGAGHQRDLLQVEVNHRGASHVPRANPPVRCSNPRRPGVHIHSASSRDYTPRLLWCARRRSRFPTFLLVPMNECRWPRCANGTCSAAEWRSREEIIEDNAGVFCTSLGLVSISTLSTLHHCNTFTAILNCTNC